MKEITKYAENHCVAFFSEPQRGGAKWRIGFTLVEIMIVLLIVGVLVSIAIPNFIQAREHSRAKACVANLREIDSAKERWAMDKRAATGTPCTSTDIAPPYLLRFPQCSATNAPYTVGDIGTPPTCAVGRNGGDLAHDFQP